MTERSSSGAQVIEGCMKKLKDLNKPFKYIGDAAAATPTAPHIVTRGPCARAQSLQWSCRKMAQGCTQRRLAFGTTRAMVPPARPPASCCIDFITGAWACSQGAQRSGGRTRPCIASPLCLVSPYSVGRGQPWLSCAAAAAGARACRECSAGASVRARVQHFRCTCNIVKGQPILI